MNSNTFVPSLFVSHGAPTFALEPELAGAQLAATGRALGKPRAVVIVSPHWMTRRLEISAAAQPDTIHDFGGFPRALYEITYPAPGAPDVAQRIADVLADQGIAAALNPTHGMDHGAWVPMLHMYPEADVPVVQVSLPIDTTPEKALALGRALRPLGAEGVMVVGSGSLTHNLYEFRTGTVEAADYAREFSEWIRDAVRSGRTDDLVHAMERAPHAKRAHPTADHYLPLLVAAGAAGEGPTTVLDGGIRHGVLAMESYVFGQDISLAVEEAVA